MHQSEMLKNNKSQQLVFTTVASFIQVIVSWSTVTRGEAILLLFDNQYCGRKEHYQLELLILIINVIIVSHTIRARVNIYRLLTAALHMKMRVC